MKKTLLSIILFSFFSCIFCSVAISDPPSLLWTKLVNSSYGGTLVFGVAVQSFIGIDGKLVTRGYLGYGVDPGCGPWNVYSIDNGGPKKSVNSVEECFRLCVMDRSCSCYVFNNGLCQLQSKCQKLNTTSSSNIYTGSVRENRWNNTSIGTTPNIIVNATSADSCSSTCRSYLWCAAFVYYSGNCRMYSTFSVVTSNQVGSTYGAMCRGFTIPAPTIRFDRGSTYYLTLLNTLDPQPQGVMNTIRDANITNIHTHGMHISPIAPSDDIFTMVNGGECTQYVWDIPSNHMGGTHLYHPHHHGSTDMQVSGGASGALIVNDDVNMDGIPQNIINMNTRIVLVQALHARSGDVLASQSSLGGTVYLVNGVLQGIFTLQANIWERWRIVHVDSEPGYRYLSFPSFCTVKHMAQDGVWRSVVPFPNPNLDSPAPNPTVGVTGATRLELAIICNPPKLPTNGSFAINTGDTLAIIVVVGPNITTPAPFITFNPKFPTYLQSAPMLSATSYQSANIVLTSESVTVGTNSLPFDPNYPKINITTATRLQKWFITAAMRMHPFHLHVNHYTMAQDCGDFKKGEFYDVMVSNGNPCTILYIPYYKGRAIMHCHNLIHEDLGVMTFANILAGLDGPTPIPNLSKTCSLIPKPIVITEVVDDYGYTPTFDRIILITVIGVISGLFVLQTALLAVVYIRFRRIVKEATSDNYNQWEQK